MRRASQRSPPATSRLPPMSTPSSRPVAPTCAGWNWPLPASFDRGAAECEQRSKMDEGRHCQRDADGLAQDLAGGGDASLGLLEPSLDHERRTQVLTAANPASQGHALVDQYPGRRIAALPREQIGTSQPRIDLSWDAEPGAMRLKKQRLRFVVPAQLQQHAGLVRGQKSFEGR